MKIPTQVCLTQSVKLYNTLKENNVTTEPRTIPNVKHGKFTTEQKKDFSTKIWNFLKNSA